MISGVLGYIIFLFMVDNHLAVVFMVDNHLAVMLLPNSLVKKLFSNKWIVIPENIPLLSLSAMGSIIWLPRPANEELY